MQMEDGSVHGIDFQNGRMKGHPSLEDYILAEQDGICPLCGKPRQHYHHIVERSKGSFDRPDNIVQLCADCHRKAHTDRQAQKQIMKIGKKKRWSALSVLNQAIPHICGGLADMYGEDHVHICFGWEHPPAARARHRRCSALLPWELKLMHFLAPFIRRF